MKVIVAGYPKTGTKTMVAALQMLGYTVYDYMENYEYLKKDWMKILQVGGSREDFRRMYDNVDACTDMPSCYFWEEILDAFPDAKVILTERDDEETWLKSWKLQLKSVRTMEYLASWFLSPTSRDLTKYGGYVYMTLFKSDNVFNTFFIKHLLNENLCVKSYRMHNTYVKQRAPKGKLLVFNVKQGWDPLCRFLQVDKPKNIEFPRRNIKAKVMEDLRTHPVFKRIMFEFCISALLLIFIVAYGLYRLFTFAFGF